MIIIVLGNSISSTYNILEIREIETNLGSSNLTELHNIFLAIFLL